MITVEGIIIVANLSKRLWSDVPVDFQLTAERPSASFGEIASILDKEWKAMPATERRKWEEVRTTRGKVWRRAGARRSPVAL